MKQSIPGPGLPEGVSTGKSHPHGAGAGSIESFSERSAAPASGKGPMTSFPGQGNGSGTIPVGPALTPKGGY